MFPSGTNLELAQGSPVRIPEKVRDFVCSSMPSGRHSLLFLSEYEFEPGQSASILFACDANGEKVGAKHNTVYLSKAASISSVPFETDACGAVLRDTGNNRAPVERAKRVSRRTWLLWHDLASIEQHLG